MDWLIAVGFLGLTLLMIARLAPRPQMAARMPESQVPKDLTPTESANWLDEIGRAHV